MRGASCPSLCGLLRSCRFRGCPRSTAGRAGGCHHGLWLRARPVSSVGRISALEGPLPTGVH
ncbi:conserved domain protein [Actinomyces sp. oral taxon 170 str. F0386]|nr:conserved domain protein [Actinomyces sp. oral taxon 170 str. F0386]